MSFWFFHPEHYLLTSSCDKYRVDFLSYPFTSTLFIPCSHPHAPNTIISYFGLDGWSVSIGLKQIILCSLLLFSVIFPPGVNHSLLYDFFPLTFNVFISSLLASNASQSLRHVCGLCLPEALAPTGSWPIPIWKDWLPPSGHRFDPVSPFMTWRSSSSSRLYDITDVPHLMSFSTVLFTWLHTGVSCSMQSL